MSKYDPLRRYLEYASGVVELRFSEVEQILGAALPGSARRHAAWWSNSGGTHVQSDAWLSAGYRTQDVDIEQQTLKFVPQQAGFGEMKQKPIKSEDELPEGDEEKQHPAYGAMKGMITIPPGVDLTEPSYPDWRKLYGEDE